MSSPYGQPPAGPQSAPAAGLARTLALVTGGLALVVYFVSFGNDAGVYTRTGLSGPLLLGGGLLAAASVLPRAPRVLVPATVLVAVGTLVLLLDVAKDPAVVSSALGEFDFDTPGLAVLVLVLAFFELAACVGALLADQGLLGGGRRSAGGSGQQSAGQQGWGPQSAPFPGQGPLGGQPGQGPQQVGPASGGIPSSGGFPSQPQQYGSHQPTQSVQQYGGQYGGQPGDYGQQPAPQPGQYGAPGQYGQQG